MRFVSFRLDAFALCALWRLLVFIIMPNAQRDTPTSIKNWARQRVGNGSRNGDGADAGREGGREWEKVPLIAAPRP